MMHNVAMIKLMFTDSEMEMGNIKMLEKYTMDKAAGKGEKWKNQVIQMWNSVLGGGKITLDAQD